MSVGGARSTVEAVGEFGGLYDGGIGATRAEPSPNIAVRWASIGLLAIAMTYRIDSKEIGSTSTRVGTSDSTRRTRLLQIGLLAYLYLAYARRCRALPLVYFDVVYFEVCTRDRFGRACHPH